MGRASISIAITSNFNSRGIDAAIASAERLATAAVHHQGKFGKAAVDMGASMGQASARLVAMGKSVAALGDKLTAGVTVPMGLAATAAVMSAAKIDTAWYNVRKTVDMTEEGYRRLKEGAMALSEVQPVSAETILNIEALGGQLGIANEGLENFAQIVSGLDIATNLDSETAATQLAQFRNIVQMSEGDMDNFASALVDLGNHTATTEADIMNLATRFASAGHVAGMSNQDILGLSAALAGLGMKADAGGSALSQVINKISLDVAKGGENVQKWADLVGEAPEKFAEAWRNAPTDQFVKVLQAIGREGADANEILNDLDITQIRQSDAMRRLASSGDLVTESIARANRAWKENTALTREVENRNESLQARWDTLVNRFTNDLARIGQPVAEMGLDLLAGLEPAIQGVGDLTQAFASADPTVQQFAFNLAGVAMAAGPVLSVTGRVMQAVGNMGQRVGRVTQQWGVYQEALRTTDISMLNTLANNKSMAAQFGASRNAIVKAAGGLDRYNVAYAKTTDSIRRNVEQQVRQTAYQDAFNEAMAKGTKTEEECARAADKAAHSRETQAVVTRKQKAAIKELNDSIDESNVKTKLNTDAVTEQEVAASKASRTFGKMGDAIKGALIGFGASAAIGLAVAGITWLVTSMQEAAERADLLDRATNGLRDTMLQAGDAAEQSGNAHRNLVGAIADTHEKVRTAIENQAELADKFREVDKQAAVQMGTIDRSGEIIERYANKGSIGAAQLSLLRSAIDDVNQACGTQYQVLEDGTVVYETETGAIQANTDEILRNIDARKRQIQMEATESKYQSAYENLIEQTYARADAIDKLSKAQDRYNELKALDRPFTAAEWDEYNALGVEIPKLQQELEELGRTYEEAANQESYYAGLMESFGEKVQGLALDMQGLVDPASKFSAAFAAAGADVVEFADACQTAGINFDFLNSLTETEIQHLAETFDGSTKSIIRGLEDLGKNDALANLGANWRASIGDAAGQIADAIQQVHGVSLAELGALATDLGIQGEDAMRRFLSGIEAGLSSGLNIDQAAQLAKRITESFDHDLDPAQAQEIARRFLQNLAAGMGDTAAIEQAIQGFKSALSQVDFTAEGQQAGSTWLAGFNSGDFGTGLEPFRSQLTMGLDSIHNTINEQGQITGQDVPLKIAEGANANAGAVAGAGENIVQNMLGALLGGVGQAQGIGSDTGTGYGSGVSNQGGTAEYAAMQTLGRLLMIWLTGIASAREAGAQTGQAYGQALSSASAPGIAAVQNAVQTILSIMQAGVGPATAAGQQMGTGFGQSLSQMMLAAATFTQAAVKSIVASLNSGVVPARDAGTKVGSGFTQAMKAEAGKAPGIANGISVSTGYAFGAGTSAASSAGSALGSAFASAVWSAGGVAIRYARNIRDQVQSIFDSIPSTKTVTLNVKTNVAKAALALPSQTPAFRLGPGGTVTPFAGASRATATAERAAQRIAAVRESNGGTATVRAAVERAASGRVAAIDYDVLHDVVRSGVMQAIRDSGGLAPTVELDGRAVSRQLAPHLDYELGRLDRMRG